MSYLPYKSIVNRLAAKRPKLVVPDHLSGLGWSHGYRVKIIPTQTFCYFDGLSGGSGGERQLDLQVNCRQHLMPHNGQLATTIQTLVGEIDGVGKWNEIEMETITYISTPIVGHYQAYYVRNRLCDERIGNRIKKEGVAFSANITDPLSLDVIRCILLNPKRGKNPLINRTYRPIYSFCVFGGFMTSCVYLWITSPSFY